MATINLDWPAQLKTCQIRIAELDEQIATQRQKIQRLSDQKLRVKWAQRLLVMRQESLERAQRRRDLIESRIVGHARRVGNLARFVLLPGQRHDSIGTEPLIQDIDLAALIADKAFDNDRLRVRLNERGAIAVIPSKADRRTPFRTTPRCTNSDTSSRTASSDSRSLGGSRHITTNRSEFRRRHPSRGLLPPAARNIYRP